mmetsp:Transcript_4308/g.8434  ORF Transcript_4308/g.8434 Transcript_4308/m.8434 type:complete len:105 (-) Transcript_4308:2242-2556(-)
MCRLALHLLEDMALAGDLVENYVKLAQASPVSLARPTAACGASLDGTLARGKVHESFIRHVDERQRAVLARRFAPAQAQGMAVAQQLILHLVAEKLPEDSPNPV